ncbi:hypothetical protein O9992_17585 [Vibrio lentus]|nr:hypothetical protein [Vibrio lentus]
MGWARTVEKLQVSYDYGTTWHDASRSTRQQRRRMAAMGGRSRTSNDRAITDLGKSDGQRRRQSARCATAMEIEGYLFNGCHRIAVECRDEAN